MLGGFQVFVSGVALVAVTLAGASTAAAQAPAEPAKPVLLLDEGEVALISIFIKADKTADFEVVLNKLKEALAKSEKPERKAQTEGWNIFKTDLMGPGGAVTYFALVQPVIKGNDYNMRTILTEAFGVADTNTIYKTLADSVVGQQIVLMTNSVSMK